MKTLLLFLCSMFLLACNPDYLDLKRDKSQTVPTTLDDFDGLLGNSMTMNQSSSHTLGMISGDEYEVHDASVGLVSRDFERAAFLWQPDIFGNAESEDWNGAYRRILYCNIILEGLQKVARNETNKVRYDRIKGECLFQRSLMFFNLAMQFAALPADKQRSIYGIPLRTESDPEQKNARNTVQETYDRIIADLLEAESLLPQEGLSIYRADKVAVQALLARVYLVLEDYNSASAYSMKTIQADHTLLNYNSLDPNLNFPFPSYGSGNTEILFYDMPDYAELISETYAKIPDVFYNSFDQNDLRKTLFFRSEDPEKITFRGTYGGNYVDFSGLSLDESYLTLAECLVRKGEINQGMSYLKRLLTSRFKRESAVSIPVLNQEGALKFVLNERKKELLFRGVRWMDLRRLNLSKETAIVLHRNYEGKEYILNPNDVRYIFPIPQSVMLNSDVIQIPR
ncbi:MULTISPECIES: RagB/SusD family nutrient uptake outer membrane protein [Sphingobacterium]|uniref:RagB/SusD family nutrient uptake outer membrane protein n=1 Tax=Sphingobacterium TaxID=28453 RepID=UPI00257D5457|nr:MULTISPECIES: RagB/SusD family nutrient uptake outer membrane protein [Sphingobacterium]